MEYIRRRMASHPMDECACFFSDQGGCTARAMNDWGADLVHVNHLRALVQLYRNPFVRPRARVVFTVHGIHWRKYDFLPRTIANRLRRFLRLRLERRLYARVDSLIALNRDDVDLLQTVFRVRCPIVMEPNTVPPCAPDPRRGDFAFISIARFDFQKGYDILLQAIARARDGLRAKHWRTLLIGGGALLEPMKAMAVRLGINDLVAFAGEMPHAADEMWRGEVLVAPSRWEGSPYTVLEALARGKRVIASECPGNRDLVRDGVNGRLFPTGDSEALASLLLRPDEV